LPTPRTSNSFGSASDERLRRLELALGRDHLGAPLALGGLRRDRALHFLRQVDVLELDQHDLAHGSVCASTTSWMRRVELVALGEQLVELGLAADRAQRGLRELGGGT
jgi:hypothetical protein